MNGKMLHITLILFYTLTGIKAQYVCNLLPQPQHITIHSGKHIIPDNQMKNERLSVRFVTGIPEAIVNPDEAYRLRITPDSILIEATTEKGIYWAQQTLAQIVESSDGKSIPTLQITDYPAFRVRGFMHDVGRSYISVEEIKKHIRLLSRFKINTFHWHLTENQGWRLQSNVFPQLNDSANYERYAGQFYTIAQAHEIADYCRKHHMMLIPEIDMPGHSAAFTRAMGADMQSAEGMEMLKKLMTEICTEVFPDVPYIHIGTDEVTFTNPTFVPEMVAFVRSLGKKVISWNPGWKYKPDEIDMTQLWSYRGKVQPDIPAIDSRFHYINHFDAFGDIVALYNSRVCNAPQGSNDIAGGIIAVWNDRLLTDETEIIRQNFFYPNMLAFAERAWRGGGSEYFDKNGVILPTDKNDSIFQSFADFERRMLWHKSHTFVHEPFPYVKQTDVHWRITDPFPNNGDLSTAFPPEKELKKNYACNGKTYKTHPATGAGIYLRHVWGKLVPAFYENPTENHTAYAYTWVYSPKAQDVGLWLEFQNYSRSEADLPPPQGKWDYRESRAWLNDKEVAPPVWTNTHSEKSNEIALRNENFTARPPISVHLQKGWNKVLLKLPVGKFTTPETRLVKWGFTCIFVTSDGKDAVEGLVYNTDKYRKK